MTSRHRSSSSARSSSPRAKAVPGGLRSQFDGFGTPYLATAERGVCAFTASGDRTIEVNYKPLKLTRVKVLGLVNWDVTVTAPPNLNVGSDM